MPYVLLGYINEKNKKNELKNNYINKKFTSKIGGKPFWLDRINILDEKHFLCNVCNKLMTFLLQIYAPIEHLNNCFHRCLYLFICSKCGDQSKCFRIQLPRINPFYNFNLQNYFSDSELSDNSITSSKESCNLDGIYDTKKKTDLNEINNLTNFNNLFELNDVCQKNDVIKEQYIKENNIVNTFSQLSNENAKENYIKKQKNTNINYIENNNINDFNFFNEDIEYEFCCKICGIPKNNKENHKECELNEQIIFEEKKIYITDEEDNDSCSDEDDILDEINEKEKNDIIKETTNFKEVNNYEMEFKKIDQNLKNNNYEDIDESEIEAAEKIQNEIFEKRQIDNVYFHYMKKLEYFPKQILRYSLNGSLLYTTKKCFNSNKNNENYNINTNNFTISKCSICGKNKVFEFQVLSTVINYLDLKYNILKNKHSLNYKFAFIAVFTCKNNCEIFDINTQLNNNDNKKSRYIQEYVYVQIE